MPAINPILSPISLPSFADTGSLPPVTSPKVALPAAEVLPYMPDALATRPGAGLDNVFIGVPGGGGPDMTGWTASETAHYNMTDRMPGWRPGLAEANYINCRPIA